MKPTKLLMIGGAFCAALTAPCLHAEEHEDKPEQTIDLVYVYSIKDGHRAEFLKNLKAHAKLREREGDPWNWSVYEVVTGPNLGQFFIRAGELTYADLDGYDNFSSKVASHWTENVEPHLAARHNIIHEDMPSITHWPDDAPQYELYTVVEYQLAPGQMMAFKNAVQRLHDTLVEADFPYHWYFSSAATGEDLPLVRLVMPSKNWADFAPSNPTVYEIVLKKHGAEETKKIFADFMEPVKHTKAYHAKRVADIAVAAKAD